jgi:hypothetical protein
VAIADYVPPQLNADAFNCPRCPSFAHQRWYSMFPMAAGSSP